MLSSRSRVALLKVTNVKQLERLFASLRFLVQILQGRRRNNR